MGEYKIEVLRGQESTVITGMEQESLLDALIRNDIYISAACGGKGKCGKCKIQMLTNPVAPAEMDAHFFTETELAEGWRLACLAYPTKDCRLQVLTGDESDFEIVSDYHQQRTETTQEEESAYDIGIDIGTTTIAVDLIGADTKEVRNTFTTINRQRAYGADVISRIQASNDGKLEELKQSIRKDLYEGITQVIQTEGIHPEKVKKIVIAGNTTMGHLLMGFSCETLGMFPFTPVDIGTIRRSFAEMFAEVSDADASYLDAEVILVPGISTYVGADISAGLLSCGFDQKEKPCILLDLGTNGEMAVGQKDKIMVTSTAAGPAFEGGNISCGMGSVKGAICGVTLDGAKAALQTIGDKAPIGLCGTGVIETVYELLKEDLIDETGVLDEDYFDDGFELGKTPEGTTISFSQKDIREIQLAKSAVRAGVETLLLRYGITYEEVDEVFLAGGFGYKINLEKAIGIGLLPEELHDKIKAVGNSSLGGTVTYLTEADAPERLDTIIEKSEEIELSTDKDFNRFYTDFMFFE